MVQPALYRLPSTKKPNLGPPTSTVNALAQKGLSLSLQNVLLKAAMQPPAPPTPSLADLVGGTGGGMMATGGRPGDIGMPVQGFAQGGEVMDDPSAYYQPDQGSTDDNKDKAPSLQDLLGAAMQNPVTTGQSFTPGNNVNAQVAPQPQQAPVMGPPAPNVTVGPIIGPPSAMQPTQPDSPYNQALRAQAAAAQADIQQNGPAINYENGMPSRAPSFGDVALNAGLTAPLLGGFVPALAKNLVSTEGGMQAPGLAEMLGASPDVQRMAGTVASLAPFTGANPAALARGLAGSEFGQRTGLDMNLPVVGSLDTLIGMGASPSEIRDYLARGNVVPEMRPGAPDAISSSQHGQGSPASLEELMANGGGRNVYPGGFTRKADFEAARNVNTPGVLDSTQKDALWARGNGIDRREVFRPTDDMQVTGEGLTFNRDNLGLLPTDALTEARQELNANPAGKTAQLGRVDAQLDANRILDTAATPSAAGTAPNAATAMEYMADAIAKADNKTPHDRAYIEEMQRIYDGTHAHDGENWNFNYDNMIEAPKQAPAPAQTAPQSLPMGGGAPSVPQNDLPWEPAAKPAPTPDQVRAAQGVPANAATNGNTLPMGGGPAPITPEALTGSGTRLEPLGSILSRAGDENTAYLRSVAADRGIDVSGAKTKGDVISALQAAHETASAGPLPPANTPEGMAARLRAQGIDPNSNPMIAGSAPSSVPPQEVASRNPYGLGNLPNRDTYYNNPAVPEALRQGSPAPVGPGEGAISPAASPAPTSAEVPEAPHPSETATAADVGIQQGPAQNTGLKLPGGEPIMAGPGQEPLQAGLPAPTPPVEAKNPLDLGAPRTDGAPQPPRPLAEMTPQEIQAEADRLGVKVDPNVVSGLLRDPEQRSAELAKIDTARQADYSAKSEAWAGNMNNATDNVMNTFRGDVDAAKAQAAAAAEKAQQQAWMNQGGGKGGNGAANSSGPPPPPSRFDSNLWHSAMGLIGAPTRLLLMGLHMARFAPQEAMRPGVLGNGIKALGEAFLKGNAKTVLDHVNNDLGPNIPEGFRAADMKAATARTPVNQTYVDYAIDHIPVLGKVLDRLGAANRAFLDTIRDAHYNYAADRLARTDPGANPDMYHDLWREANNATGHSTLIRGSSTSSGLGIGWGALTARVEELTNTIRGSGAPVPGLAAGSRAEAFKSLAGVASTMAATAALGSALGAKVNTSDLTNKYGVDSTFLHPITNNGLFKTIYGTGGAGYDTLIKAAINLGIDLSNGDLHAAEGHLGSFARGEFGVVPGGVIDALLGKTWDGKDYSWHDFVNEAKTGFQADQNGNWGQGRSTPISARANLDAIKAYGPIGALRALPSDIADESNTRLRTKSELSGDVMNDPALLAKALPANIVPQVQGQPFSSLAPREMALINAQRNPADVAQIEQAARANGDPYQLAADQKKAIQDSYTPAFDRLQQMLDEPHADAYAINTARNTLTGKMFDEMDAVQTKTSGAAQDQSPIQALVAGYKALSQISDRNARTDAQQTYLNQMGARYGTDMEDRLRWNVSPSVNENAHPLTQAYEKAGPVVSPYFAIDSTTDAGKQQRADYLQQNPAANATLAYYYGTPLKSGDAIDAFVQQHPGVDRPTNVVVGFSNQATSYRNLPASYAQDIATERSFDASTPEGAAQRAQFLAERPDLNVLLVQTGHTSHVYSIAAYQRLNGQ